MRFFHRALTGLFLLAVTVGLLVLAGRTIMDAMDDRADGNDGPQGTRERVFTAEVATVDPQAITPVLTAFGEIRTRRSLELRAPVAGEIIELTDGFEDGGAVEVGQILLRIDPAEAEEALATARTDLAEAMAELADAERSALLAEEDLAAAEAQADLRSRALDRQRDLATRGVGSAAAVEEAELAAAAADQSIVSRRQALAQAQSRVDLAGTSIARREIAVTRAERELAETELRAGFDGVLADVAVVAGGLVSQNEQVARLIDPDALEVAFRISTAQYTRLLGDDGTLPSAPASVILDVLGLDVTASAVLDRESGAVGEGQSGRLLFARMEAPRGFRAGDFVTVEVEEPELQDVARLPATAIDGANEVLVVGDDNRLEEFEVQVVRQQGDDILVRAPPLYGREVVLARTPVLGAGIQVNPLRAGPAEPPEEAEIVILDPERRARLISFVENNNRIPADVRERMIRQLNLEEVPARMVERIESRMGS